jgi:xanthine dehydrogenase accessory factor
VSTVGSQVQHGGAATLIAVTTEPAFPRASGPAEPASSTAAEQRPMGSALHRWVQAGAPTIGVVRVLDRHGFGTVEAGQLLAAAPDGDIAGTVLRGVLDRHVVPLAIAEATGAPPITREVHVAEDDAVDAGLACSGGATLLAHPLPAPLAAALGAALERGQPAALAATVDGAAALVLTGPELADVHGSLGDGVARRHRRRHRAEPAAPRRHRHRAVHVQGADLLLDVWVPVPSVLVVGAGAIGDALSAQAALLGWTARRVTVSTRRSPPSPASRTRTCSCCSTTTSPSTPCSSRGCATAAASSGRSDPATRRRPAVSGSSPRA